MHLHLDLFDDQQLNLFVDKWFSAEPSARADLVGWLALNPKMRWAARTPVVAAVLCSLHSAGADKPSTEVELYEERFALLLGEWEKAKGIDPLPLPARRNYWHFLMRLAFRMHVEEVRMAEYSEVRKHAKAFILKGYHGSVDSLIEDCLGRNLIAFNEHGQISFGHLTYQEYLAARWLASQNPVELILSNLKSSWWDKTVHFYCARIMDISRLFEKAAEIYRGDPVLLNDCLRSLEKLAPLAPLTDKSIMASAWAGTHR